jgi:hypothetical protein
MSERLVNEEEALVLLEMGNKEDLLQLVRAGVLRPVESGRKGHRFRVADLVSFELARIMRQVGTDAEKSVRYAEAVLAARLPENDKKLLEWVENEAQELFCLLEDGQLARIFIRSKHEGKSVDVGAVKPVLFPTVRTEINVFRAIRPLLVRTRQLKGARASR